MIETPRLLLREWRDSDVPFMAAISADSEVMRYFPSIQSLDYTQKFVRRMQDCMNDNGYCYFPAIEKKSNECIGFIGLCYQNYDADFTPCIDIGWRLAKNKWGNGYATEGARACLSYAKDILKLKEVVSVATASNVPSIHVMKKIGMEFKSEFLHPALADYPELEKCHLYSINLKN